MLELLEQSLSQSKVISFTYADEKGRTTEPRQLETWFAGPYYAYGFDHYRQKHRIFLLNRMSNPVLLEISFTPPEGYVEPGWAQTRTQVDFWKIRRDLDIENNDPGDGKYDLSGEDSTDQPTIIKLGFGARAFNSLMKAGISKISEVLQMSDQQLLAVPSFGRQCLIDIDQRFSKYGMKRHVHHQPTDELEDETIGKDLTSVNLTGVNLTRADLTGVNLTRADLTGVNLTRADLSGIDLSGKDLTDAILTLAGLTRADLYGADLTGANLVGAVGADH